MKNKQTGWCFKVLKPKKKKKDELKQIEGIFLQNLINDLIRVKLKEIANLSDIIETDETHYKSTPRKV